MAQAATNSLVRPGSVLQFTRWQPQCMVYKTPARLIAGIDVALKGQLGRRITQQYAPKSFPPARNSRLGSLRPSGASWNCCDGPCFKRSPCLLAMQAGSRVRARQKLSVKRIPDCSISPSSLSLCGDKRASARKFWESCRRVEKAPLAAFSAHTCIAWLSQDRVSSSIFVAQTLSPTQSALCKPLLSTTSLAASNRRGCELVMGRKSSWRKGAKLQAVRVEDLSPAAPQPDEEEPVDIKVPVGFVGETSDTVFSVRKLLPPPSVLVTVSNYSMLLWGSNSRTFGSCRHPWLHHLPSFRCSVSPLPLCLSVTFRRCKMSLTNWFAKHLVRLLH